MDDLTREIVTISALQKLLGPDEFMGRLRKWAAAGGSPIPEHQTAYAAIAMLDDDRLAALGRVATRIFRSEVELRCK